MSDFAIAAPKVGVAGRYKFEKFKGEVLTGETPWFNNLITDVGLDALATSGYLSTCNIGSGNANPQFTDTQLQSLERSSSTVNLFQHGAEQEAPYRVWTRFRYVFNPTGSAYNVSEVGVGPSATLLLSRSLIKDSLGQPTTISILGDETLYVTFEFSIMVPTEDVTGTITFTGNVGGTYDFICRAANCTEPASPFFATGARWSIVDADSSSSTISFQPLSLVSPALGNGLLHIFSSDIQSVTQIPSGSVGDANGALTSPAYIPGSHYSELTETRGLSQGNLTRRSQWFRMGPACYQIQFDPPIPKTSSRQLSLTLRHSWGRA